MTKIQVATLQMDATPAPLSQRLQRAETLIAQAAAQGAQLIVLPELFNTGCDYTELNYERTETLTGETYRWMKTQAAHHGVHLMGSWLIVSYDDVYNAAFIIAPDGETWRYHKQYPFLWERSFYRDGRGITVAETALGKIGVMIGWDAAHTGVFERYAAKVDVLVILSAALNLAQAQLALPTGETIPLYDLGTFHNWVSLETVGLLQSDLYAQAAWMRVPIICATASGTFHSMLPVPTVSATALLAARRDLWQQLERAAEIELIAPFERQTQIISATGEVITRTSQDGDSLVIATLPIDSDPPLPKDEPQPELSVSPLMYGLIDGLGVWGMTLVYRRGTRRQWGARMAPMDASTRIWTVIAALALVLGWLIGRIRR